MQLKVKKTTKTLVKTPKGNKKTPKKVKEMSKLDKKTSKQGKQQQKTLQSKPEIPQIPKSARSKRQTSNKKQKLDENKIKEINTPSTGKQNQGISSLKKSKTVGSRVRVALPRRASLTFSQIMEIFEGCKHVYLPSASIQYNSKIQSQKVEKLEKLRINGKPLRVKVNSFKVHSLKRTIWLQSDEDQEKVKKLYEAKSIEKHITRSSTRSKLHVLTFKTEKEAEAASQVKVKLGYKVLELRPYFITSTENEGEKVKQKKRKADQKE